MKQLKYIIPLFAIMVIAQIYVPTQMIWQNEGVIKNGRELHLRIAPVDPNDPFRGKYVVLNFLDNQIMVDSDENWRSSEIAYLSFEDNKDGFSIPSSISRVKPSNSKDYLQTTIDHIYSGNYEQPDKDDVFLSYPFDRYYMEENKAYEAEIMVRAFEWDTSQVAYAVVFVHEGKAIVEDLMINDISVKDLVEEQ